MHVLGHLLRVFGRVVPNQSSKSGLRLGKCIGDDRQHSQPIPSARIEVYRMEQLAFPRHLRRLCDHLHMATDGDTRSAVGVINRGAKAQRGIGTVRGLRHQNGGGHIGGISEIRRGQLMMMLIASFYFNRTGQVSVRKSVVGCYYGWSFVGSSCTDCADRDAAAN